MDSLEGLWQKLKLSDEEEVGVNYEDNHSQPHRLLAAKFLTKRMVNIESVARTFKPLWRTQNEFKIKDMGDNKLFFVFEEVCDLERVLEHEPWTYDKHLVIFERVEANIPNLPSPSNSLHFGFKYTTSQCTALLLKLMIPLGAL